jgi:hypothetical protein
MMRLLRGFGKHRALTAIIGNDSRPADRLPMPRRQDIIAAS